MEPQVGETPSRQGLFSRFAQRAAVLSGRSGIFLGAIVIVFLWALSGPYFHYSDTWQLVINTGTTIITFLMVFLIQHTQNRDMVTIQIKLSELILAVKNAENSLAAVEELSDEELEVLRKGYHSRAEAAAMHLSHRKKSATSP